MSKPVGGTKPLSRTQERFQHIQETQFSSPTEHSAISKRNSEYINHLLTLLMLIVLTMRVVHSGSGKKSQFLPPPAKVILGALTEGSRGPLPSA